MTIIEKAKHLLIGNNCNNCGYVGLDWSGRVCNANRTKKDIKKGPHWGQIKLSNSLFCSKWKLRGKV